MVKNYILTATAASVVTILVFGVLLSGERKATEVNTFANSVEMGTVTVTGKTEVKVVPDRASVQVGVDFKLDSADEANKELSRRLTNIREALLDLGVAEKDIATGYYSVQPDFKWVEEERVQTGYRGLAELTISGIDMDAVDRLVDVATSTGADTVGSIQYYSSDYDECYGQALEQAVIAAKAKAERLGKVSGFEVLGVHDMVVGYQDISARYVTNKVMSAAVDFAGEAGAISSGEIGVEASVEVTYKIE